MLSGILEKDTDSGMGLPLVGKPRVRSARWQLVITPCEGDQCLTNVSNMCQTFFCSPTTIMIPFSLPTDSSNATHDAAHITLMNAQTSSQRQAQFQQETSKTAELRAEEVRDTTPPGMAPTLYDAADHPNSLFAQKMFHAAEQRMHQPAVAVPA